jgi:uncharacterized protein
LASASPPVQPATPDLLRLDPSVVKLWRLTHTITAAVFMLMASVSALVAGMVSPADWPWMLAAWVALAALFLWVVFWYPARAYRAWGYRIDEKVLETHHGIWFRVIQLLPLSRLQHVDLHRGPLERSFGLSTLILHTAGTQHAILTIPGLAAEQAVRLRDHLVAAGGGDDAV